MAFSVTYDTSLIDFEKMKNENLFKEFVDFAFSYVSGPKIEEHKAQIMKSYESDRLHFYVNQGRQMVEDAYIMGTNRALFLKNLQEQFGYTIKKSHQMLILIPIECSGPTNDYNMIPLTKQHYDLAVEKFKTLFYK